MMERSLSFGTSITKVNYIVRHWAVETVKPLDASPILIGQF
jgi:hypothetical protein